MQITRRRFCGNTLAAGLALGVVQACTDFLPTAQASGNRATYLNPVLGGDHPDAGAIRVGNDFFLTHSSFDYAPGLPIWSSKDLVNWTLAGAALKKYYGSVWAPLWRAPRIHGELLKLGIEVSERTVSWRPTGGRVMQDTQFLEKLAFPSNQMKMGGWKMSRRSEKIVYRPS